MESKKLRESIEQLDEVIKAYDAKKEKSHIDFLGLSKAFEIAVEYGWRHLKIVVEDEGLDAPSPKGAVRQAAKIGLIKDPELWIDTINARNDSVHDYFGIGEDNYVELAKKFLKVLKALNLD